MVGTGGDGGSGSEGDVARDVERGLEARLVGAKAFFVKPILCFFFRTHVRQLHSKAYVSRLQHD